jgi:hypothetical protein
MADSSLRRAALRLRAFVMVAFPFLVVTLGAGVFCVGIAVIMPLARMISSLS